MGNCIEKVVLDGIICDIKVLNMSLDYWLKGDNSKESCLSKNSYIKHDFDNFNLDNIDILNIEELNELIYLDKETSSKILSCNFEKSVLLKRKNMAVSNLDIVAIVDLSRLLEDVDDKISEIKNAVSKHANKYAKIINDRLNLYNKFVEDVNNSKSIKNLHKKKEYDYNLVRYYRYNRICNFIVQEYEKSPFDLNDFFGYDSIKDLLEYDYLSVRQRVGALCGSK